jgi:hypothetical protein
VAGVGVIGGLCRVVQGGADIGGRGLAGVGFIGGR